jgi:two-component system, chemotaxis family, chemotaxis protein CheY
MKGNGERPALRPKVLIVDDDDEIRHVLRLLFEFEDFEVIGEAESGIDAVRQTMVNEPDLVILDYLMPRMDGEATAGLLRSLVPEVRIVVFSAILEEKPEWADAYLNKERISEIAPMLTALIGHGERHEAKS